VPPLTTTSPTAKSLAASLNVNESVATSPKFSSESSVWMVIVGTIVSTAIRSWVAARLPLPARSLKLVAARSTLAFAAIPLVGVNSAL
jgi:hypothetical protein